MIYVYHIVVYKVKKIACKSLKGKGSSSGLRLIYAFCPSEDQVIFIELYYKQDKEDEDKKKIKTFLESQ